ncbi:unnamed protein product [Dicrocoelium dendriticum]|nr:unnamed protein product [Dicrocoelium dendriticum]
MSEATRNHYRSDDGSYREVFRTGAAFVGHAEADTFYCFNNLMAEIHLNFIRKLDNGRLPSIGGQLRLLMDLLAQFDMPLFEHLRKIGLETEHYAFRWFSLLLAREFNLPEVLRLWDTLFSDEHRFSLLPFMCCSMLMLIRDQLLSADFPTAVNLVQFSAHR